MKKVYLIERIRELDSRCLEYCFFLDRFIQTGNMAHYRRAQRALKSYQKLVAFKSI